MNKVNVRAVFSKRGRAVYISHLDLMKAMQRALKRSKLPVWYTEGYNPRIYLNFPLALSLGVESACEPMDMAVVEEISPEEIMDRLNAVLPEGIAIEKCFYPKNNIKDMGFAEYNIAFAAETGDIKTLFDEFTARETIIVKKHSKKKGEVEVDIKPYINVLGVSADNGRLSVDIRLPASIDFNLNAGIVSGAFLEFCREKGVNAECCCTKRTNILCIDGSVFA